MMDAQTQEMFLVEILAPRSARGVAQDTYTLDDFKMDSETSDKIMEWATSHITAFFTKAVARVTKSTEVGDLAKLMQSVSGLANSAEAKLSAGPSESVRVNLKR